MSFYPAHLNIKDCAKGPSKGGLPAAEVRKLAQEMGINVTGLKKAQICDEIERKLAAPTSVAPVAKKPTAPARVPTKAPAPAKAPAKAPTKAPAKAPLKYDDISMLRKSVEWLLVDSIFGTDLERGDMLWGENFRAYGDLEQYRNGKLDIQKAGEAIINFNKQLVSELPRQTIIGLVALNGMLNKGKVKIMDEEQMVAVPAADFIFDLEGNLIIKAPR